MAFKFKKNSLMLLASAAMIAAPMSLVYAASTNIDATANFRAGITLAPVQAMDFGGVDFTGVPAATDTATLNTDGSIAYAGVFDGSGTGTAGEVQITGGSDGETVEVSCDMTATMNNGAGSSIQVTGIGISQTAGATTGTACAGVGTPSLTYALNLVANDRLYLGGVLDGNTASSLVPGAHSTSPTGDDIEVQVVYQ